MSNYGDHQRQMLVEKWMHTAPRNCQICDTPLHEMHPHNLMHIIPKGLYPALRLFIPNTILACFDCHYCYDHETHKAKADEKFTWVFETAFVLKTFDRTKDESLIPIIKQMHE